MHNSALENVGSHEIDNSPNTGGVVQTEIMRNSRKHQMQVAAVQQEAKELALPDASRESKARRRKRRNDRKANTMTDASYTTPRESRESAAGDEEESINDSKIEREAINTMME